MPPAANWPSEAELARLTSNLLSHQASAPGEIAEAFLHPLTICLRGRLPHADPDLCEEAAGMAITATVCGQNRYDPARLPLDAFLRMAAFRDLLNLLASETTHRQQVISLESVEELAARGNTSRRDDDLTWDEPRLVAEMAAFAQPERLVLDLMRGGFRDTADFAGPLGLTHLPIEEQAAEVKRVKDRVKKRLSRAVGGDR